MYAVCTFIDSTDWKKRKEIKKRKKVERIELDEECIRLKLCNFKLYAVSLLRLEMLLCLWFPMHEYIYYMIKIEY